MSTGDISTAPTMREQQHPAWRTALIALAVLLVLSEAAYLFAGMRAKICIDSLTSCVPINEWLYGIFFMYAESTNGAPAFMVKTSFGLPGFNNIFYIVLGNALMDQPGQFLATVAASLLVGFLALWGYLALGAQRGALMKLLFAAFFAIGWFALYNNAEASIFGADFFVLAGQRYWEIPVAFVSLLLVSLLARRRSA